MAIDFQEDKEIDFQVEDQSQPLYDNIDFKPEAETKILTGKVEKNEELTPYEIVLRDNTLTREQKAQRL